MMRGPVVPQPSITRVRIVITGVRTVLCGVLRQHISKHPITPSAAFGLVRLPDDVPPTRDRTDPLAPITSRC